MWGVGGWGTERQRNMESLSPPRLILQIYPTSQEVEPSVSRIVQHPNTQTHKMCVHTRSRACSPQLKLYVQRQMARAMSLTGVRLCNFCFAYSPCVYSVKQAVRVTALLALDPCTHACVVEMIGLWVAARHFPLQRRFRYTTKCFRFYETTLDKPSTRYTFPRQSFASHHAVSWYCFALN